MAASSLESNFVSMKPAVEFINILDQYCCNEDLICEFKFNDYTPQEGDRIAIFKLGWSFVKDYLVFEWAPVSLKEISYTVVFNKHILPKNDSEIYQICYVSGENELHGASSPFQFTSDKSGKIVRSHVSPIVKPEKFMTNPDLSVHAATKMDAQSNFSVESKESQELMTLKEENAMLRESLKAMIQVKCEGSKNYDKDIGELRDITDSLKVALNQQQQELNMLKVKIREGGEEYKKLYLQKLKLEKKLDRLKNKRENNDSRSTSGTDFDIEDLKSIPPFPFPQQ